MIEIITLLLVILLALNGYVLYRLLPKSSKHINTILLDTSALIDGRIVEVVKSGFMPSRLLIPRFVIAELQLLADKADHLKRERARYGLSVIQDLQSSKHADTQIISDDIPSESGVDEKLVRLAIKRHAMLYSTDYNLLKVAEIEGIRILNINELTQNLRPVILPGEQTDIKIVQRGQERDQGVGYLDDGTMVVVDNTKSAIGKIVRVEFTRNLQTAAGRMMFAQTVRRSAAAPSSPKKPLVQEKETETAKKAPAARQSPHRSRTTKSTGTAPRRRTRTPSAEDALINTINSQ